jgi:hypothetical protein
MQSDEVLARLVQRMDGRYYGKYRGQVSDNDDPLNLGRVKAKVPRLLGDEETGWALPAFPYGGATEQGFFAVPDTNAGVWIEFEEGDLSYPIWSGTWYTSGDIPESAKPSKKVWKTKSGHKIVLDDDGETLEVTDKNDNSIKMDSSTIKISAGNATKIVIDAPQIEIVENSSEPLVFGNQLTQYLNQVVQTYTAHIHPVPVVGASGPPAAPLTPPTPSLLSTKVTTG